MDENLKNNIVHIGILLVLLIVLLFILVFTGILSCGSVPGGCDAYYSALQALGIIKGQPVVLIAQGEAGMGDPQKLEEVLSRKEIINASVKTMSIDRLTYGNVTDYQLIIVERARKICSDKLKIFMYYVNRGGKLVWTGDAGTELCVDDRSGRYPQTDSYLLEKERVEGGKGKIIGPWARKDGDKQLSFDEFLGVSYIGRHCESSQCTKGELTGYVEITSTQHKLAYGLSPSIPFSGDFALVQLNNQSDTRLVAVLDYGTNYVIQKPEKPWLEAGKRVSLERKLPFIASSGVGDRVAYYAAPIESFVSDEQPQKNRAIVEQLYYGMLYK